MNLVAMKIRVSVFLCYVLVTATVSAQSNNSYSISIPSGVSLICNQLDHGSNTLNEVFTNVPDGCVLYKYDTNSQAWHISAYSAATATWPDGAAISAKPGEGIFLQSSTAFTLTFTGTPHVPVLPVTIPAGQGRFLSRQTVGLGNYTNIVGTVPPAGAGLWRWNGNGFNPFTYSGSVWLPAEPIMNVGEAVWIAPSGGSGPPSLALVPVTTNKTVDCSTSWDFDPPQSPYGCSSTNIQSLVVLSSVTNGTCPLIITRSWRITDGCSNTYAASQTVTVSNSLPPVINCPGDKSVVACGVCTVGTGLPTYNVVRNLVNANGDGKMSFAPLFAGSDGALYGTTSAGGSIGYGTVFKVNPDGTGFGVLSSFASPHNEQSPFGGVIRGTDGALYGTTSAGGGGIGSVFTLQTDGSGFQILYDLLSTSPDGASPSGELVEGTDGALYGTARDSGPNLGGVAFRLQKNGTGYTILHGFGAAGDGLESYAGLIQASDGMFYGTTVQGGAYHRGTVFKMDSNGNNYSILRSLSAGDGTYSFSSLLEGSDGNLYGLASAGGVSGKGTIFKLDKNGNGFTTLKNFSGPDGHNPVGRLIEGCDGALYGATYYGGTANMGVVFKINKDGTGFGVQKSFNGTDGKYPMAGLVKGSDGAFYGTTSAGGSDNSGVVYRLAWEVWKFDQPTAYDACSGSPLTPTTLGTTFSGSCPETVTRTWVAIDACGNTNTCSQTITVISTNMIYSSYNRNIQLGLNFIASQLFQPNSNLNSVLPAVPDGSILFKYSYPSNTWLSATFSSSLGGWIPDNLTLSPGEGAVLQSPSSFALTFTGTPHVPVLPIIIPVSSAVLLSRQTNDVAAYEDIVGASPAEGAVLYQWTGSDYTTNIFSGGSWILGTPNVAVGESVWISSSPSNTPPLLPDFYTVHLQAGYNLICNQLDHGSNRLDEAMPEVADGTVVSKYNNTNATWTSATFSGSSGKWTPANLTLKPGEGAILQSPASYNLTFTGTPHVPVLPVIIPSGTVSLLGRQTNDVGGYSDITGLSPTDGTTVYQWSVSNYVTFTYSGGGWSPFAPSAAVGESLWIASSAKPPPPISVNYAGSTHVVLGNTSLIVQSNQLIASFNLGSSGEDGIGLGSSGQDGVEFIGSSGQDGVRFITDPITEWGTEWQNFDANNLLRPGAGLQMQVFGSANSISNGLLGTVTVIKTGSSNYVTSADFSPMGVFSTTVRVFNGTNLTAQMNGLPNGAMFASARPDVDVVLSCCPWRLRPSLGFAGDVALQNGPTVSGDSVEFEPEGVTGASFPTSLRIQTDGIATLIFIHETISPLVLHSTAAGHSVVLSWFGNGILQRSTDLVNWNDLTGTASPATLTPAGLKQFYRIKQPMGDQSF